MRSIGALGSVQAFFVLSGMYMAAVWHTKYSLMPQGAGYFYYNRALRLWPTYLFLLALTFLVYVALGRPASGDDLLFNLFRGIDQDGITSANAGMLFLSVFLFGQDFVSVNENLHYLLPVRQSWSIASELLFYLSVPLVFRKPSWKLYFAGFAALMVFKYLASTFAGWRYSYFLPIGSFGYFLLGGTLYHLSLHPQIERLKSHIKNWKFFVVLSIFLAMLFLFGESSFERGGIAHHFAFIAIFSVITILLFEKVVNKMDLFLGNISYGIYLNHFLVLVVGMSIGLQGISLVLFTLAFSILLSFLTEKLIQYPIDRQRYRITTLQKSLQN